MDVAASHCAPTLGVPGMKQTVLVVEDDALSMKLSCDLLELLGCSVLKAGDGIEALKLARRHRPDLILMNIQLPGISGLATTKLIKEDEELKSIPVVAVTALAMEGDKERLLAGGCDGYIPKPVSVANFNATVRRFLDIT